LFFVFFLCECGFVWCWGGGGGGGGDMEDSYNELCYAYLNFLCVLLVIP